VGIDIPCLVWIPRVTARRLEAEMAEDPVGTLERIRRKRRATILGFTLGTALALVPVVWFLLR
jgi:hypothetical protein